MQDMTVNKFGLYSDKSSSITFETHLEGLQDQTKIILQDLRNFVKSLGENVVEEVRSHRVVYAKTLTFRTFLDVQPRNDCITVSIRRGRNEPENTHTIKTKHELENVTEEIRRAYEIIK
jgi:predicted transport protein